jgi:hypothetical protein
MEVIMAKKIDNDKKKTDYNIERIRTPMSREKLNDIYNDFKSDDDYLNYHIDVIDDTHVKYKITIVNDEYKSPIKNSDEERSFGYMEKHQALEFIEECINNNKVSSKPKAVMQNGFSKKAIDKYKDIVMKEEEECDAVGQFTKPTFDEIMNNIYVNTYNGSTYHVKDNDIPDDLREDVGVIIPGMIETKEEYFEFVKRLKDRGRNGLGRSIYDRYEDYEEAKELIERYKQALFDKYGSKEEFFYAKDMGGMFGAYEYYPTVKPRFKKTMRNIKMDKGINLNELALVKDMGKRIRDELDKEIEQIEVDGYNYTFYENTPPKFKDLPDDLKMFYKTDKYNINGFTHTNNFTSLEAHAEKLIRSKDPNEQIEGYRILEDIKSERMLEQELYKSEFTDIADTDELTVNSIVSQYEYDKLMYEFDNNRQAVEEIVDVTETREAYRKFLEYQLVELNGYDMDNALDKNEVNELVKYGTRYVFDKAFRMDEDEKASMNSVAENLYINKQNVSFGNDELRDMRSKMRKGDNKVTAYVRELAANAKQSLQNMNSNADNVNVSSSTVSINDVTSYNEIDKNVDGFELNPTPEELLAYMKNNDKLAKKIYEISSEQNGKDMFSERTNIDEFVDAAKIDSKPMITKGMIEKSMKSNRRG